MRDSILLPLALGAIVGSAYVPLDLSSIFPLSLSLSLATKCCASAIVLHDPCPRTHTPNVGKAKREVRGRDGTVVPLHRETYEAKRASAYARQYRINTNQDQTIRSHNRPFSTPCPYPKTVPSPLIALDHDVRGARRDTPYTPVRTVPRGVRLEKGILPRSHPLMLVSLAPGDASRDSSRPDLLNPFPAQTPPSTQAVPSPRPSDTPRAEHRTPDSRAQTIYEESHRRYRRRHTMMSYFLSVSSVREVLPVVIPAGLMMGSSVSYVPTRELVVYVIRDGCEGVDGSLLCSR